MRRHLHIQRAGFSLIELLMAIFILGIGLVSIASLLPTGIMFQQRAEDELYGPLVASDALHLIRSKVDSSDFGTWWDFHYLQQDDLITNGFADVAGDIDAEMRSALKSNRKFHPAYWLQESSWPWLRPAVVTDVSNPTFPAATIGTLDVFNALGWSDEAQTVGDHTLQGGDLWTRFLAFDIRDQDQSARGIPYNIYSQIQPAEPSVPEVLITPEDRSWPNQELTDRPPRYYWDCVFRRMGQEVQVAIFVYRVKRESVSDPSWSPQAVRLDPGDSSTLVPLTQMLALPQPQEDDMFYWTVGMQGDVPETALPLCDAGDPFDLQDPQYAWQLDGQYLLDQYGTMHRVSAGRRRVEDRLALASPVPQCLVSSQLDVRNLDEYSSDPFWASPTDRDQGNVTDDPHPYTATTHLPPVAMAEMRRSVDFPAGMIREEAKSKAPVVDRIWFLPRDVTTKQGFRYQLIPVYAMVGSL